MDDTLDRRWVEDLVRATIEEDLAGGVDVTTTATVQAEQISVADFVARVDGVIAGLQIAELVLRMVAGKDEVEIQHSAADGAAVKAGDVLLTVRGKTRELMTAEGTTLKMLGQLSGVGTLTRSWGEALGGRGGVVGETR